MDVSVAYEPEPHPTHENVGHSLVDVVELEGAQPQEGHSPVDIGIGYEPGSHAQVGVGHILMVVVTVGDLGVHW